MLTTAERFLKRAPLARRSSSRSWIWLLAVGVLSMGATGAHGAAVDDGRDAEKIRQVEAGEVDRANASWWGFDEADATEALQAAIDSGARTVVVPNMGTPWIVRRTIELTSDQTVIFEDGVVVEAKEDHFHGRRDFLFVAVEAENLRLEGDGATFRMRKRDYQGDDYEESEWRHTLALYSVKNVEVIGLTFEASGGDGIYLGASGSHGMTQERMPSYCQDVTIRDVVCRDNHRQGISVISVSGLLIENTVLEGTSGTPPQAGIDFEPFRSYHVLEDIVMRDCLSRDNVGGGYMIWVPALKQPVSLRLENCRSVGDRIGLRVRVNSAADRPLQGGVEVVDSSFEQSRDRGIAVEKPVGQPSLRIVNSEVRNPAADAEGRRPIMFHSTSGASDPVGGVTFENLSIHDPLDRTPIGYTDHAGGLPLEAIDGTLIMTAGESERRVELTPEQLGEWIEEREWVEIARSELDEQTFTPLSGNASGDYGFETAQIRGRRTTDARFAVYAQQGETVALRLQYHRLANSDADPLPVTILDPFGETVHEQEILFEAETDVAFDAEAGGLYKVQTEPFEDLLTVTESTHPVNVIVREGRLDLKRPNSDYHFWVPENTTEFAVEVSGEGSSEGVDAMLIDPDGDVVYHEKDLVQVAQFAVEYPGPAPSKGEAWILRLGEPSSSLHFGDVHVDLRGVPPLLAPSRDALLRPRD